MKARRSYTEAYSRKEKSFEHLVPLESIVRSRFWVSRIFVIFRLCPETTSSFPAHSRPLKHTELSRGSGSIRSQPNLSSVSEIFRSGMFIGKRSTSGLCHCNATNWRFLYQRSCRRVSTAMVACKAKGHSSRSHSISCSAETSGSNVGSVASLWCSAAGLLACLSIHQC